MYPKIDFKNGKAKSNPRKSDWLNNNFGPDSETPFNVEACDEAWQGPTEKDITCPFGGYIQVKIQGLFTNILFFSFRLKKLFGVGPILRPAEVTNLPFPKLVKLTPPSGLEINATENLIVKFQRITSKLLSKIRAQGSLSISKLNGPVKIIRLQATFFLYNLYNEIYNKSFLTKKFYLYLIILN